MRGIGKLAFRVTIGGYFFGKSQGKADYDPAIAAAFAAEPPK